MELERYLNAKLSIRVPAGSTGAEVCIDDADFEDGHGLVCADFEGGDIFLDDFGGITAATVLAIFFIPLFYVVVRKLSGVPLTVKKEVRE